MNSLRIPDHVSNTSNYLGPFLAHFPSSESRLNKNDAENEEKNAYCEHNSFHSPKGDPALFL